MPQRLQQRHERDMARVLQKGAHAEVSAWAERGHASGLGGAGYLRASAYHGLKRDAGGRAVEVGLSDKVLHRLGDLLEHSTLGKSGLLCVVCEDALAMAAYDERELVQWDVLARVGATARHLEHILLVINLGAFCSVNGERKERD